MTPQLDTRPPRPSDISSDATLDDTDVAPTSEHGDNATVDFERLAHDIARAGVNALTDDHLDLIERAAHAVGVRPVLIDILFDSSQPDVTRARAYGRIATKILNTAWAATSQDAEPQFSGTSPETDMSSVNTGGSEQTVPPANRKDPP